MNVCGLGCSNNLFGGCIGLGVSQVFSNGCVKQVGFLVHNADLINQVGLGKLSHINSCKEHLPLAGGIEPRDQVANRSFTRTRWPHKGCILTLLNLDVYLF